MKAQNKITTTDGVTSVHVWRDYGGDAESTAQKVWSIVSDFGGLKKIFPNLVRIYITYPDAVETQIKTLRNITFQIPDGLAAGVEQLVALDPDTRSLTYISVSGLPVTGYESVMKVSIDGSSARLDWISTFNLDPGADGFPEVLAGLLGGGADQIAKEIGS